MHCSGICPSFGLLGRRHFGAVFLKTESLNLRIASLFDGQFARVLLLTILGHIRGHLARRQQAFRIVDTAKIKFCHELES